MPQLTQMLRRAVQVNGGGIATICSNRTQDWATLADRAARLAGALAGLGYRPGDRIGILALNCDRYLEYFFGMACGGFIFVPVNTRLAPPEIVYWLTGIAAAPGCLSTTRSCRRWRHSAPKRRRCATWSISATRRRRRGCSATRH